MARTSDPHSATAQFFINGADNDFLNHKAPTRRAGATACSARSWLGHRGRRRDRAVAHRQPRRPLRRAARGRDDHARHRRRLIAAGGAASPATAAAAARGDADVGRAGRLAGDRLPQRPAPGGGDAARPSPPGRRTCATRAPTRCSSSATCSSSGSATTPASAAFEARCIDVLKEGRDAPGHRLHARQPRLPRRRRAARAERRAPAARPDRVVAFGERLLVSHGDALCLGDVGYQRFRPLVRHEASQRAFLAAAAFAGAPTAGRAAAPPQRPRPRRRRAAPARRRRHRLRSRWLRAPTRRRWSMATRTPRRATSSRPGTPRHVLSDWDLDAAVPPARRRAALARWRASSDSRPRARCDAGQRLGVNRLVAPLAASAHPRPPPDSRRLWQGTLARASPSWPRAATPSSRSCARWRRCSSPRRNSPARAASSSSDAMAVAIAAQACLPALKLGLRLATTASSASSSMPMPSWRGARWPTTSASSMHSTRSSRARRWTAAR